MQHCDKSISLIAIEGYNVAETKALMQFFSHLLRKDKPSSLFVDIWNPEGNNQFMCSSLSNVFHAKNRFVGEIQYKHLECIDETWFNSRCTLLCSCGVNKTVKDYTSTALKWCPEKALRKGLIQTYICGDADGGFVLGRNGYHPETLQQLKKHVAQYIHEL